MGAHAIPVASRSDLVTLKKIALEDDPTRKTDRADLKALEAVRIYARLLAEVRLSSSARVPSLARHLCEGHGFFRSRRGGYAP